MSIYTYDFDEESLENACERASGEYKPVEGTNGELTIEYCQFEDNDVLITLFHEFQKERKSNQIKIESDDVYVGINEPASGAILKTDENLCIETASSSVCKEL